MVLQKPKVLKLKTSNLKTKLKTTKLKKKIPKVVLQNIEKKSKEKIKSTKISSNLPVAAAVTKAKAKLVTEKKKKKADEKKKNEKSNSKQKQLESLKEIDPEFYKFLQKNDKKLLDFDLYDSDDSSDNNVKQEGTGKDKEFLNRELEDDEDSDDQYHKPNADLEVASDESDFENSDDEEGDDEGTQKITLKLLKEWQIELEKSNVSATIIRKVIQAFSAALSGISVESSTAKTPSTYKAVGAAAFNGIIQLCVLHLQAAILRFLNVAPEAKLPLHKTKKWPKLRSCLRYYLNDLIRLIDHVSSTNILSVLLKHLHQMAAMLSSYSHLATTILKKLISLWATGDESIRVLSFLCILKITRNQQMSMLNNVIKAMYLSYVRNSKFVSPSTLPMINFMRRSLVEILALDLDVSYQHVFLYIRQLAIHLRNAVILKKKDSYQMVYNWQFVNSIHLWADLLALTANQKQLEPLIYPLVTITIGVIRLIPTAQYFPLRFHCIQSLITLAKGTNTFIPILPLIVEVLRSNTFNAKPSSVSMKPLQFTCILRLNKGQLAENGFRDEVIEQVFGLSLEYLAIESASLAFADLSVPAVSTLKAYLKICKNPNYSRKIKQLIDKIADNVRFIEQERHTINCELKDAARIQAWERQLFNKGTPLNIYYNSWLKTQQVKKRRQAVKMDNIENDYQFLNANKPKTANKKPVVTCRNSEGNLELFPSDSEDISSDAELDIKDKIPEAKKKIRKVQTSLKRTNKLNEKQKAEEEEEEDTNLNDPDTAVDIVKDLDFNDW